MGNPKIENSRSELNHLHESFVKLELKSHFGCLPESNRPIIHNTQLL